MTDEEAKEIVRRAKSVARMFGYQNEADDFAQYAAFIALTRGSFQYKTLLIDFLRLKYGATGKNTAAKSPRKIPRNNIVAIEECADNLSSFDESLTEIPLGDEWNATERALIILSGIYGLEHKEIGYVFNVSECRVSQIFQAIKRKAMQSHFGHKHGISKRNESKVCETVSKASS